MNWDTFGKWGLCCAWSVALLVGTASAEPVESHCASLEPSRADWTVMTKTHKGLVSILKGLTEQQARQAAQRLTPTWRRPDYHPQNGRMLSVSDGEITELEAWGPDGKNLEVWPKNNEKRKP